MALNALTVSGFKTLINLVLAASPCAQIDIVHNGNQYDPECAKPLQYNICISPPEGYSVFPDISQVEQYQIVLVGLSGTVQAEYVDGTRGEKTAVTFSSDGSDSCLAW